MKETLASEICHDLKRHILEKNVVICLMAAFIALGGAAVAVREIRFSNTVATFMGR